MANKKKIGKHEYWQDGEELWVPLKHISQEDRDRDAMVMELVADALKLQMLVKSGKAMMEAKLEGYLAQLAEEYGEEWQGNARIRDFSQKLEVEVTNAKLLTFDEKLAIAKQKVDACIGNWSKNSRTEIIALVNQAFRVNQTDQPDVKALLKLPTLEIDDPEWVEAMEIIKDSVTVLSTRQYLNFRLRKDDGKWEPITLNFSRL